MDDKLIVAFQKLHLGGKLTDSELAFLENVLDQADVVLGLLEFHPDGAMFRLERNWVRQELNRVTSYIQARKERANG